MIRKRLRVGIARAFAALLVLTLAGCANTDMSDLRAYVREVLARKPGPIAPLPQPTPYETFAYSASGLRSPFVPETKRREGTVTKGKVACKIEPNVHRARELLEGFPLDTLRMVGSLRQGDHFWALVQSNDGTIHRVTVGNHLGQNFGKIVKVTEDKVQLVEIIPDGEGCWRHRSAALALSNTH